MANVAHALAKCTADDTKPSRGRHNYRGKFLRQICWQSGNTESKIWQLIQATLNRTLPSLQRRPFSENMPRCMPWSCTTSPWFKKKLRHYDTTSTPFRCNSAGTTIWWPWRKECWRRTRHSVHIRLARITSMLRREGAHSAIEKLQRYLKQG